VPQGIVVSLPSGSRLDWDITIKDAKKGSGGTPGGMAFSNRIESKGYSALILAIEIVTQRPEPAPFTPPGAAWPALEVRGIKLFFRPVYHNVIGPSG
jgi:hypothetical protein